MGQPAQERYDVRQLPPGQGESKPPSPGQGVKPRLCPASGRKVAGSCWECGDKCCYQPGRVVLKCPVCRREQTVYPTKSKHQTVRPYGVLEQHNTTEAV
jgi:hypothetical protein